MNFKEFLGSFREFLESSPAEELREDSRYVFLSDLHMGDGSDRDDLASNGRLILDALARYLEGGYTLVLGGDIEELQKFSLKIIKRTWSDIYEIFDAFAARGALRKIVGNHDLALLRHEDHPYPLIHGLRLIRDGNTL
ncbi:MAG: metallophosphoesterase, partial [Spirochaetaceae bacterium]|nr:metallophosphoesterase [Spirochaetaceae bacterium]